MEELVVSRTRELLQYKDCKDLKVAAAGIELRAVRKWRAGRELSIAELWLRQKNLVMAMATGHPGLDFFPRIRIEKARNNQKRQLIQSEPTLRK